MGYFGLSKLVYTHIRYKFVGISNINDNVDNNKNAIQAINMGTS